MAKENNNGPIFACAAVCCVLIITLGVVFLYSGWMHTGGSQNQTQTGGSLSSISVSASGTAKGVPSMAQISMFINATGSSTAAATANLSSKLALFNSTIASYIGGNASLVQTSYYNVGRAYTNATTTPVYQAQESVTVTLPQVSRVNGFLANITVVPDLQVQGVSATLSNAQISQLRQQALQAAISNATNQATAVIGNVAIVNTTIAVGSYYATPFPVYALASGSSANGGPAVPPGKLYYNGTSSVYENIQATFYYRK